MENLAIYLPNLGRFWCSKKLDITAFVQKFVILLEGDVKVSDSLYYFSGTWLYNRNSDENLGSSLSCRFCNHMLIDQISMMRLPSDSWKDSLNSWICHQNFIHINDTFPIPREKCCFIGCDTLFVNKKTIKQSVCPGCGVTISLKSSSELNQIYLSKVSSPFCKFTPENILARKLLAAKESSNRFVYKIASISTDFHFFIKVTAWEVVIFERDNAYLSILCDLLESCTNYELIELLTDDLFPASRYLNENSTPLGNYIRIKNVK